MNILAVDTAGKTAGVALLQDDRLLYEVYLDAGMTHSETLMPMIDTCSEDLRHDLRRHRPVLASTHGPGSFTGLRIGLAAVKGLAFRGKRCAHRSPRWKHWPRPTPARAPCSVHWMPAVRRCTALRSTLPPTSACWTTMPAPWQTLADFVENCKKPLFFVGDGAALCYNKYGSVPGVPQVCRLCAVAVPLRWPCGKQMAEAGQSRSAGGSAAGLSPPEPGRAGAGRASGRRGCRNRITSYCDREMDQHQ